MSYLSESVGDVGTSDRDRLSHLVAAVFRRAVGRRRYHKRKKKSH